MNRLLIDFIVHTLQIYRRTISFISLFGQVLSDFSHSVPNAQHNVLTKNWKFIAPTLHIYLKDYHKNKLITDWCPEINDLLALLRPFPVNCHHSLASLSNFERAIDKLIILRMVRCRISIKLIFLSFFSFDRKVLQWMNE